MDLDAIREVADERSAFVSFAFDNHVAALAEANEIGLYVSRLGAIKVPIRNDVVNRNSVTNKLGAPLAFPAIAFDGSRARFAPALAAIGCYATNIIRSIFAGLLFPFVISMAWVAAKSPARFAGGAPQNPRKNAKQFPALSAIERNLLGLIRRNVTLLKSIRRSQAFAPFVSDLMAVWHFAIGHVPNTPATLTTKPRSLGSIRANLERLGAYFAFQFRHFHTIAGTTGVAMRQGDLLIAAPPPAKPEQQGFDLSEDAT